MRRMGPWYHGWIVLLLVWPVEMQAQAHHYFYTGKDYGSEAVFNPISLIINEGYGILQLEGWSRDVTSYPYQQSFNNVMRSLRHPFKTIQAYGVRRFFSSELLPLSTRGTGGGQWLPNYTLHMIGGGMGHVALHEWYEAHGYPRPGLFSWATVTVVHLLNETIENNHHRGYNGDAVADMYIFDTAGMLLFRSRRVRRFFSETLNMASWMAQPGFILPDVSLQNNGQFYSIKWKLPRTRAWHFFYYGGMNTLFGLAYRRANGTAISVGGGVHSKKLVTLDAEVHRKTVTLTGSAGIFYDRNNSLLASLVYSGVHDRVWNLNVYPGVVRWGPVSFGFWIQRSREGHIIFGLSNTWTPGLAWQAGGGPDPRP